MFERSFKYCIRQFIPCSRSPGGEISHVLEDGVEAKTGLTRQLVLVEELLQQRLFERLPVVSPELVLVPLCTI